MAEADRIAIEDFGIDVLALMENAGVAVAKVARRMLGGRVEGKSVCCLVGKGNNGGDGLVAARHLYDWGARASVVVAGEPSEVRDIPAKQLNIVRKMGIRIDGPNGNIDADLLIDALLGYGSRGSPREPIAGLISRANSSKTRILAVDIPSGLDATSGEPEEPCIVAKATITFGFPKSGFLNPRAGKFVGALFVADISMPRELYLKYQGHPIFAQGEILRIGDEEGASSQDF